MHRSDSLKPIRRQARLPHTNWGELEDTVVVTDFAILNILREKHIGRTNIEEDMPVIRKIVHKICDDIRSKMRNGMGPLEALRTIDWNNFVLSHPNTTRDLFRHVEPTRLHDAHLETRDERLEAAQSYFGMAYEVLEQELKQILRGASTVSTLPAPTR